MAYRINEQQCLKCGYCEDACPTSVIYEKKNCYQIDGSSCVDCGHCTKMCCCNAIERAD